MNSKIGITTSVNNDVNDLKVGTNSGSKNIRIYLIKPSLYDQDGYVIRFKKGVLPSNTMAVLNGLTEEIRKNKSLGEDVNIEVRLKDEIVDLVDPEVLIKEARQFPGKTLYCLCGVQTNMFARAADLARALVKENLDVMIGGFHVSGILSIFKEASPEMTELMEMGVTLVAGEVEESFGEIIEDACKGELKPLYSYLDKLPVLDNSFLPTLTRDYLKKFAVDYIGTMDCGRGCPYRCTFCTIINVQGNNMRQRETENLKDHFRSNYLNNNISYYFFTDDNFSRNPKWSEIFDFLIELWEEEGINIEFMMQVDTQAYKIPNFIDKSVRAGCTQVFIGMESLNPDNLSVAGKKQNKVDTYHQMIKLWRDRDVMTQVGYIIGFPFDTPEIVEQNIHDLSEQVGVDMASFFILTPLPGSQDHRILAEKGTPMSEDMNQYDSFRPVTAHPKMTDAEWIGAYNKAWKSFYSLKRMSRVLAAKRGSHLRDVFGSLLWYKYSIYVHQTHPMICGFVRLKDRKTRRPTFKREGRVKFFLKRSFEVAREIVLTLRVLSEFLYMRIKFRKNLKQTATRMGLRATRGGVKPPWKIDKSEVSNTVPAPGKEDAPTKKRVGV